MNRSVVYVRRERKRRPVINAARVLEVLGLLLLVEAAFMLVPMLLSLSLGEEDWVTFALAAAATGGVGYVLKRFMRPSDPTMRRRDGCLLTASVWVVFSFMGMIPFLLCSTPLDVSEAFFETMSGFTTTGATVIRDVESCSRGILLWRALIQWIGGMGIVVFTLAIIPSLNNGGGLSMFNSEVSGITHDKLEARVAATAKYLWGLYAVITLALVLLLWAGPMSLFDSMCQAMTTISTGGYSTRNDSIAGFDSTYVKIVLTVFMFIGGTSFSLLLGAVKGGMRRLWRNDVFRMYLALIGVYLVGMVLLNIRSGHFAPGADGVVDPLFHIVSAMTSTGFGACDFESWGPTVLVLTIFMMYVGACAGSTTGGAKLDRLLYLVKNFRLQVSRSVSPRLMRSVRVGGSCITPEQSDMISAFMLIFTFSIVVGGVCLAVMGFPVVDAFFSAVSCAANNGLGAGVTGISGSYDLLPPSGRWLMSLLMLAGRLEVFTVIVLLAPSFWRR